MKKIKGVVTVTNRDGHMHTHTVKGKSHKEVRQQVSLTIAEVMESFLLVNDEMLVQVSCRIFSKK
jgi:hypothetical protein